MLNQWCVSTKSPRENIKNCQKESISISASKCFCQQKESHKIDREERKGDSNKV